jgi:hypothetical protein
MFNRKSEPKDLCIIPILQVLQCLSGQGLTSSGGSGQVGSEGGNSSGASRAAVKERLVMYTNYSSLLFDE